MKIKVFVFLTLVIAGISNPMDVGSSEVTDLACTLEERAYYVENVQTVDGNTICIMEEKQNEEQEEQENGDGK